MKLFWGFVLAWVLLCGTIAAQTASDEITLYAATGKPIAYIADDDDSTIYLWSGKPVARTLSRKQCTASTANT